MSDRRRALNILSRPEGLSLTVPAAIAAAAIGLSGCAQGGISQGEDVSVLATRVAELEEKLAEAEGRAQADQSGEEEVDSTPTSTPTPLSEVDRLATRVAELEEKLAEAEGRAQADQSGEEEIESTPTSTPIPTATPTPTPTPTPLSQVDILATRVAELEEKLAEAEGRAQADQSGEEEIESTPTPTSTPTPLMIRPSQEFSVISIGESGVSIRGDGFSVEVNEGIPKIAFPSKIFYAGDEHGTTATLGDDHNDPATPDDPREKRIIGYQNFSFWVGEPGSYTASNPAEIDPNDKSVWPSTDPDVQQIVASEYPTVFLLPEANEMGPGGMMIAGSNFKVRIGRQVFIFESGEDTTVHFFIRGIDNADGSTPRDGNIPVEVMSLTGGDGILDPVMVTRLPPGQRISRDYVMDQAKDGIEGYNCGADGCERIIQGAYHLESGAFEVYEIEPYGEDRYRADLVYRNYER